MAAVYGELNRSTQHFIVKIKTATPKDRRCIYISFRKHRPASEPCADEQRIEPWYGLNKSQRHLGENPIVPYNIYLSLFAPGWKWELLASPFPRVCFPD